MALSNEHERIAIAIGEALVGYEAKIAIGHTVAETLFGKGHWPPDLRYVAFRRAILSSHRLTRAKIQEAIDAQAAERR